MTAPTGTIQIETAFWEGDPDHSRYSKCDTECAVCGRPMVWDRGTVVHSVPNGFGPITLQLMTEDPSEWGWAVGTHCAKRFPKTHKVSVKRAYEVFEEGA